MLPLLPENPCYPRLGAYPKYGDFTLLPKVSFSGKSRGCHIKENPKDHKKESTTSSAHLRTYHKNIIFLESLLSVAPPVARRDISGAHQNVDRIPVIKSHIIAQQSWLSWRWPREWVLGKPHGLPDLVQRNSNEVQGSRRAHPKIPKLTIPQEIYRIRLTESFAKMGTTISKHKSNGA
jgi:hypothetical protein